jgi:hypothetical protein
MLACIVLVTQGVHDPKVSANGHLERYQVGYAFLKLEKVYHKEGAMLAHGRRTC